MKLKLLLLRPNSWRRFGISRVFDFRDHQFYSAETIRTSSPDRTNSLHLRVTTARNPNSSMTPILEQWVKEGRDAKQSELRRLILLLRNYRRFSHSLQISEWMSDQNHDLSTGDIAIRLDLVSKIHGLEEAEKYFNSVPDSLRVLQVYGALLNCYARGKSLEKAEAVMEKIKELGFAKTSLPYNVMLNLYYQLGKYEKLDIIMQEMEEKGIKHDNFTFNTRLNAYGASSDLEGMEKLLMKMEADPNFSMDWNSYAVAANWYQKAGLTEQSLAMLRKSEEVINSNTKRIDVKTKQHAYETLLTSYAAAGNKDEVYRIWSLYKSLDKFFNSGYLRMISSLLKLDDIDGAERVLEEWESGHMNFDNRVPVVMVRGYCRKGLYEKAEAYVNRLIESGKDGLDAKSAEKMKREISARQEKGSSVEVEEEVFEFA